MRRGRSNRTRRPAAARLLAAAVLGLAGPRALPADFFGPAQGVQLQPELDLVHRFSDDLRLIAKLMPTFIPSESYSEMGGGVYASWLVAPLFSRTITPDLTKRRRLDVRAGLEWFPSRDAGTAGESNVVQVEAEATSRLALPGYVLATLRSRVEARWQRATPTSFAWRARFRPQLEREFGVTDTMSLAPFANAEVIWSTARNMWDQFRVQVGLQLGVYWFGGGQIIEVNASTFTYLQPSRSHSPVVGVVWYQFF